MNEKSVLDKTHSYRTLICINCLHAFSAPVRCGNRFCNTCSGSSRSRVRRKLAWIVDHYVLGKRYRFKHITLTIRSESSPDKMQKSLLSAFRRLRQRQLWRNLVDGGAYVVEVAGVPGKWHLHLHILCAALRIPYEKLLRDWKKVSGSSGLYIQNCNSSQVIAYVTKYISKTSIPLALQMEASAALKGSRMFQPFGSWHSIDRQAPKTRPSCPCCGKSTLECLDVLSAASNYKAQYPVHNYSAEMT